MSEMDVISDMKGGSRTVKSTVDGCSPVKGLLQLTAVRHAITHSLDGFMPLDEGDSVSSRQSLISKASAYLGNHRLSV